jgi:hypothetical protein
MFLKQRHSVRMDARQDSFVIQNTTAFLSKHAKQLASWDHRQAA